MVLCSSFEQTSLILSRYIYIYIYILGYKVKNLFELYRDNAYFVYAPQEMQKDSEILTCIKTNAS